MRWSRLLSGVWLFLSAAWTLYGGYRIAQNWMEWRKNAEAADLPFMFDYSDAARVIIGPPLLLLALGLAAYWVVRIFIRIEWVRTY
jgi:hypothetical protein